MSVRLSMDETFAALRKIWPTVSIDRTQLYYVPAGVQTWAVNFYDVEGPPKFTKDFDPAKDVGYSEELIHLRTVGFYRYNLETEKGELLAIRRMGYGPKSDYLVVSEERIPLPEEGSE